MPTDQTARRVLGYARVSSAEQALGTSLQDQQNALQAYAKGRGLEVDRFFVEAESGIHERFERREQIQLLMADLRSGDLILADKLDRWSRDPEFTYKSVREMREKGARIFFVGEQLDPTTAEGDSMLSFRVAFAREEHKRIKVRMVGTRKLLRDRGYYAEGLPPCGYRRSGPRGQRGPEKNVLAIDARDAALVRTIFKKCVAGQALNEILAHLHEHRPERAWSKSDIHKILHNRMYIGESKDSRGVWIKGLQTAIIDEPIFSRAQDALASRRLGGAKPRSDSHTKDWLLREIARCGKCGAKIGAAYGAGFGKPVGGYVYYYKCAHRPKSCDAPYIPVGETDAAAAALVLGRLVELREHLTHPPKEEKRPEAIDYTERKAKLQRKRDRFLELYADGTMAGDELRLALGKVDTERTKLADLESVQARRSPLGAPEVRRTVLGHLRGLQMAWRSTTTEQRRRVLRMLASSARLERGKPPVLAWYTPDELATELSAT